MRALRIILVAAGLTAVVALVLRARSASGSAAARARSARPSPSFDAWPPVPRKAASAEAATG